MNRDARVSHVFGAPPAALRHLFIACIVFGGSSLTARGQEAADQALQRLRSAIQCPTKPVVEHVGPSTNTRTITLTYSGNAAALKVDMHIAEQQKNSATHGVMDLEAAASYITIFQQLASADVQDSSLTIRCKGEQKCIRRIGAYSQFTRQVLSPSMTLVLCDPATAADAKRAVEELVQVAATSPDRPLPDWATKPLRDPDPGPMMGNGLMGGPRPGLPSGLGAPGLGAPGLGAPGLGAPGLGAPGLPPGAGAPRLPSAPGMPGLPPRPGMAGPGPLPPVPGSDINVRDLPQPPDPPPARSPN
jgi:hypothetical protein